MLIKEFCAENLTDLPKLDPRLVQRVELCDNLAVGGTTPSYGVLKEGIQLLHQKGIEVASMIRPRSGNFVYTPLEISVMLADCQMAIDLGADALVLGCLTEANQLDLANLQHFLPFAQQAQLVFHMAFDQISPEDQAASLESLISSGFTRILLHGSPNISSIYQHYQGIAELRRQAKRQIQLMIGGGVTAQNCQELADLTGVEQVHGTKIVQLD